MHEDVTTVHHKHEMQGKNHSKIHSEYRKVTVVNERIDLISLAFFVRIDFVIYIFDCERF